MRGAASAFLVLALTAIGCGSSSSAPAQLASCEAPEAHGLTISDVQTSGECDEATLLSVAVAPSCIPEPSSLNCRKPTEEWVCSSTPTGPPGSGGLSRIECQGDQKEIRFQAAVALTASDLGGLSPDREQLVGPVRSCVVHGEATDLALSIIGPKARGFCDEWLALNAGGEITWREGRAGSQGRSILVCELTYENAALAVISDGAEDGVRGIEICDQFAQLAGWGRIEAGSFDPYAASQEATDRRLGDETD